MASVASSKFCVKSSYEEDLLQSTAYFGTPDEMCGWLRGLQQQYQMEYFGLDMAFGGLPHEKVMRAMKLFAAEVMPKFQ